jgi:hypothetical protein
MKRIDPLLPLFLLMAFTGTAFAAGAVAPDGSSPIGDYFSAIVDAVKHGQFALAGSVSLLLMMAAAKRYLPDSWGGKYVRGDGLGGVLSTFVMSFAGSLAIALAPTGATVSGAMALAAAKFALVAIGGYVALHKLATALVGTAWFQNHAPAWLKSGVALVLALIGSSAIAKAEKAGEAAVKSNPPAGPNAAAGEPSSI